MHTHTHSQHAQNQGTAMAQEPAPGCVVIHRPANQTTGSPRHWPKMLVRHQPGSEGWSFPPLPVEKGLGTTQLKLPSDPSLFSFQKMRNQDP